jgi:hypothetical protein
MFTTHHKVSEDGCRTEVFEVLARDFSTNLKVSEILNTAVAGQIRDHFLANSSLFKIDSEEQAHILVAQLLGLPVPQINGSIVTGHIFV